jgi:general stress protein YciG
VATSSTHGRQFYEAIGQRGGETRREQLGHDGYAELGRKGGEATSVRHGPGFYAEIGKKGGQAVSRDRMHMSQIGRKGGEARAGGLGRRSTEEAASNES